MDDKVTLVGVKPDGTEEVIGTATMPPKMKARQIVRDMFGEIDEDGGDSGAMALWCCEQLLEWMEKTPPAVTVSADLERERAARQEAQRELERYKGLLARARLDVTRELREQGWRAPVVAPAFSFTGDPRFVEANSFDSDTICATCGSQWGEHYGALCPAEDGRTFQPSAAPTQPTPTEG